MIVITFKILENWQKNVFLLLSFHYIDGAADDEITYNRNTAAYNDC